MNDFVYRSVSELLDLFKTKELSPVAVLEAQIDTTLSEGAADMVEQIDDFHRRELSRVS